MSGSPLVKVDALRVLGTSPHSSRTEAREVLKKSLSDADFLVRSFAAKVLGQLRDTSVLPLLKERLAVEQHETAKKILGATIRELEGSGG